MRSTDTREQPTAVLKSEHQIILRVINVLRRLTVRYESGQGFEAEALLKCVEFFRYFADACHHAKEEDLLFPVLAERGIPKEDGPIGVMLEEHRMARQFTAEMAEALDDRQIGAAAAEDRFCAAAAQYMELLTNHIFKEDNILFNMGDRVLSAEDQESMCGKFCEVQCHAFGGKTRDELEAIADELEKQWSS